MKHKVRSEITVQAQRVLIVTFFLMTIALWLISRQPSQNNEKIAAADLKERITEENGVTRIDYVNDQGQLRIATNLGYSTIVRSESNGIVLEQYLDDEGNNVSAPGGYFFALRAYDENMNNIRIEYLGHDKKPMIISTGCAIEEKSYSADGRLISVYYYDTIGDPVCTPNYGYGRNYEYDSAGNISKMSFLNFNGKPIVTDLGYAIVKRTYYDTIGPEGGKTKYEFYYDEDMNPISLPLGHYGIYKVYDEQGNNSEIIYLDNKGKPFLTNQGYSKIIRTYHKDNTLASECYYDLQGTPVSLAEGQYGKRIENGKTIFLNADGSEQFNIRNILYNNRWYVVIFASIIVFASCISNTKMNIGLLVLYIGGIAYLTLMFRTPSHQSIILDLFWSYKKMFISVGTMEDIFRNIWLFIPLGAILYSLYPKKVILIIPILLSGLIELVQYITKTGIFEFDDIINNGLGGAIGYVLGSVMQRVLVVVKNRIHMWCISEKRFANGERNKL